MLPAWRLLICLSLVLPLGACSVIGGRSGPAPVEERSGGRVAAPTVARPGDYAPARPDPVLVSPLEQPGASQWTPLEPATAAPAAEPEPAPSRYTPPRAGELNPAVVALLNRANEAERTGQLEQSAANLERALRIQPGNAWLWHRLSLVRLFQSQSAEAISTAEKSNSLAAGNRRLQADNWRVIAQARERLGQTAAAATAARQAEALSR